MTRHPPPLPASSNLVITLAAYAFVGSLAAFLGWPLDVPQLTTWFTASVSIQPNTCVLIMLSAAGIAAAHKHAWRVSLVLGGVAAAGGALILLEHILGANFGFDDWLIFERTWGQEGTTTPGRPGPPAAASLMLIGAAVVLLALAKLDPAKAQLRRFVPVLGVVVGAITLFSLLGYLFEARQFYTIPWLTAIALPAASLLFALGAALTLCVPERDPMRMLSARSGAGALGRITLPALAIMIPTVLWLRTQAFEAGYFDLGMGYALGAFLLIVGSIGIVWTALHALRRHEAELSAQNQRKDEFLATLAHELRNPLAPLSNALMILERAGGNEVVARDACTMMSRQLRQLVRLIDDLLDVSRINSGRLEIRKERVELVPIVADAVDAIRPAFAALQQALQFAAPAQPIWLEADRVRLDQILTNLLNNASRYSPRGAPVEVRAFRDGNDAVIIVKDQGIGIPSEQLDAVFEMFTRVDSSLERVSGGLGIGLYLVRRLAQLHGGTAFARSDGIGKGSEFVVRLPGAIDAPQARPAERTAAVTAASSPATVRTSVRVLVVDDNEDAANTTAALLRSNGYVAHVANDGLEAIEAAAQLAPDVVLLDIGMPNVNGYEVCKHLRQQSWGPRALIVALTGWGQKEDKARAAESGFDAHLVKPVEWAALVQVLERRPP